MATNTLESKFSVLEFGMCMINSHYINKCILTVPLHFTTVWFTSVFHSLTFWCCICHCGRLGVFRNCFWFLWFCRLLFFWFNWLLLHHIFRSLKGTKTNTLIIKQISRVLRENNAFIILRNFLARIPGKCFLWHWVWYMWVHIKACVELQTSATMSF